MTFIELVEDLIWRYTWIDVKWRLVAYMLTVIFTIAVVVYGKRHDFSIGEYIILVILFLYLAIVYMSTVMARWYKPIAVMDTRIFRSWIKALSGDKGSIKMVIENIIMLMPIGVLWPLVDRRRYCYVRTVAFGFSFSLFIETSQYVRRTGLFEVDDLINNTLGVIAGCVFISLLLWIVGRRKKKAGC